MDITPDDCTLAHMAAVVTEGEGAEDSMQRLKSVERTIDTRPVLGCISCSAQIRLEDGKSEPKGVGLCRAPFADEARAIVAPRAYETGQTLMAAIRRSLEARQTR